MSNITDTYVKLSNFSDIKIKISINKPRIIIDVSIMLFENYTYLMQLH